MIATRRAALKHEEIDWDAPIALGEQKEKGEIGKVVLKMDNLKKYYEVSANALFGGCQQEGRESQRNPQF